MSFKISGPWHVFQGLLQCLLNPCLTIFKLLLNYILPKSSYVAGQVHNNCFLHLFSLLTKKYPTVHVILLFRFVWEFRPYAQGQCHTHTLGPHGYGLANFTLDPLLTHTPYGPVRTRMGHIKLSRSMTKPTNCAPSKDLDQPGPSLIRVFARCALNG